MKYRKKAALVFEMIEEHWKIIESSLEVLLKIIQTYSPNNPETPERDTVIHFLEQASVEMRRKISQALYHGALFPNCREDVFHMSELADEIANAALTSAEYLSLTRPLVEGRILDGFIGIADSNILMFKQLAGMRVADSRFPDILHGFGRQIRRIEREIDKRKFDLSKEIYKTELPRDDKLHIKTALDLISEISNHIEDTADYIEIMGAKAAR